jgi:hypothetical protein
MSCSGQPGWAYARRPDHQARNPVALVEQPRTMQQAWSGRGMTARNELQILEFAPVRQWVAEGDARDRA